MKTSWLNGSKRILSALLIAAALMFGWTPLGEGKALAATAEEESGITTFALSNDSEWYPYITRTTMNLRTTPTYSSSNLYGSVSADTYVLVDLQNVTKAVVSGTTYWYAPVLLDDNTIVYCDISKQSVIRPLWAPDDADWWEYKVVYSKASTINMRSFANSYPTTNILTKIPKNAIVELDLNHTATEPKFGDTWALARYKQSDGSYIYGWVIESDSNYIQRQERPAMWVDYVVPDDRTMYVYDAPNSSANAIGQVTASIYMIDVANIITEWQDGESVFWARCKVYDDAYDSYQDLYINPVAPGRTDSRPWCYESDYVDWTRYVVLEGCTAMGYTLPNADSAIMVGVSEGCDVWVNLEQSVTVTENDGTKHTYLFSVVKFGDNYYATWFDNQVIGCQGDYITESLSVRGEDSTYTLYNGHVSWQDAVQYAARVGGHLAVITSAEEDELIQSTLMGLCDGDAWIGAHATSDGTAWRWVTGEDTTYTLGDSKPSMEKLAVALYHQSDDFYGWTNRRDCENIHVGGFIVEVKETKREWFTYRIDGLLEFRNQANMSGQVQMVVGNGYYCSIDLMNVAMDESKKHFFAPVLMDNGSILYCDLTDKKVIVPDLEPDEPTWTQYKALSSLYVRTFPNAWCDTGVLKTLSKDTILELDVSHKLRDPRFGNDWAYARCKQSDGTYLYGWVIAANSYVEQVKQTPAWYDYFANPGSTVYVYKTQNVDDTIVKTYTSGSSFQVDVNNMRQDQNGYLWAPVADNTGKELGYTDLSAAHAGGKSAAIPLVYCQSGWALAYVLAEEGMDVLAAPNDAAALVKHMDRDAYFWFGADETYTDAKGKIWTRIYAAKDYEEMADGGWVRLENGVNYNTVYAQRYDTGCSISRNGITYTLYGGYNSWSSAQEMCANMGGDGGTAVRKHLAIVHNDAEQKIIEQLLNATSTVDKAWIGASNTSGSWKWLDGTNVQYSQWGYNEPSGTGTGLGAAASFDGSWYAHDDYLDIHIQGFITEQFTGIGLPQVKLPASTFYVDDEAFVGNSTIQSVVAPDGLQVIGTRAFADCANLKCITLPDSVSYIAEDAFENTPDVVIFASVGSYAWQWAEKQGIPHGTPYTE